MHRTATDACGLGRALEVIGGKWRPTMIWLLHEEPRGFGDLRRALTGISEKVLSEQLKAFEADDVVHRHVSDGPVVRTTYSLTPRGQALNAAVHTLAEWGSSHPARSRAPT
jgi:DNA-binding HxlR family transcriptional regulator